jgi:curved DNA-binding protein
VHEVARSVRVVVPAESRDGDVVLLAGEGGTGPAGRRSDLLVRLAVRVPDGARLDGDDLHLELPLTVGEAWGGARLDLPTPTGMVVVSIPPALDPRVPLRLRGRGLARRGTDTPSRGDLVLHPLVVPPDRRDPAAAAAVGRLAAFYAAPVRPDFDRLLD